MERSVEIKPSVAGFSNLASAYFFQERRYFRAAQLFEEAAELDELNYVTWGFLGDARYWDGDQRQAAVAYERALSRAEELRMTTPQDAMLLGEIAFYNAMLERPEPALEILQEALELAPDDPDLSLQAAQTYQQLGQTDDALRWLGEGIDGGLAPALVRLNPWFDSIQDTEALRALMPEP